MQVSSVMVFVSPDLTFLEIDAQVSIRKSLKF